MRTSEPNQPTVLPVNPRSGDPEVIAEAGRILRNGGLVVLPTETVYGIAADALSEEAVSRLRMAKGRPETKPLPVMVSGAAEIAVYTRNAPDLAYRLAERFWPGPLTLVLWAERNLGEAVHAGTGKVGLRAPDDHVAQGILAAARGPLVLTSANLSGQAPALTAQEAVEALGDRIDLYIDAGPCSLGEPSTVLDLTTESPTILRAGALSADDLIGVTG